MALVIQMHLGNSPVSASSSANAFGSHLNVVHLATSQYATPKNYPSQKDTRQPAQNWLVSL